MLCRQARASGDGVRVVGPVGHPLRSPAAGCLFRELRFCNRTGDTPDEDADIIATMVRSFTGGRVLLELLPWLGFELCNFRVENARPGVLS
jgi:hypothetical protein